MMHSSIQKSLLLLVFASGWLLPITFVTSQCLGNSTLNEIFAAGTTIPQEGSCCQEAVCAIPCPLPVSDPGVGFGIAVGIAIAISFIIGLLTYFVVKGEAENYFVAGKSLPLWIVAMTLGAQSVDSNALLGNVDLSYKVSYKKNRSSYNIYCILVLVLLTKTSFLHSITVFF